MRRLNTKLLSLLFLLGATTAWGAAPEFRAGAVTVDITPRKLPSIIAGGFLEGRGTKVNDPLFVRCIVLDDGSTKLGFAIVDTCMMTQSLIDDAKRQASSACGIPVDHLMVSATHTHSAPAAMGCLGTRQDKDYAAWLPGKIAEGIVAAERKLQPAKIGWASIDDWANTHNRRWVRRPETKIVDPFGNATGLAHMHPGYLSRDVIGPSGPVDPSLSVISIQTKQGQPLAVLANYSQHYFGAGPVSSDYYGLFCKYLAKSLGQEGDGNGPFVCAMSQGTSGDLMWMDYGSAKKDVTLERYAESVAKSAEQALKRVRYRETAKLGIVEKTIELSYRVPSDERLAWAKPIAAKIENDLPKNQREVYAREAIILHERQRTSVKLQAIRIGDLTISTLPNEVYAITGLKLKAQSPFTSHFNIELANGAEGYIPPPEQHVLGGYTTWPARTAGLEPQAEPRMVATLLDALEEVTGKPRRALIDEHGPYAKAVLAAKPVGYWRLNEIAGTTSKNAVEGGPTARLTDGFAWFLPGVASGTGAGLREALNTSTFSGPRQINRSVHLAGGEFQADITSSSENYSIVTWFWLGERSGASERSGTLIEGLAGESLRTSQGKDHRVKLLLGDRSSRSDWQASDWHMAILVREDQTIRVYMNGGTDPEISATVPVTSRSSRLVIGRGLQGKIDEVATFDRSLKPEEIQALWKAADVQTTANRVSIETLLEGRELPGEWVSLFNGKNLEGFHTHLRGLGKKDPDRVFQVHDGAIHIYKDTPAGQTMPFGGVITDRDFGDYHLRFEFKWGTKKFAPRTTTVRDAGLLFHVFGEDGGFGGTWSTSVECQVQEQDVGDLYVVGTRVSTLATPGPKGIPMAAILSGEPLMVGDRGKIARVINQSNAEREGWNTVEVIARGDAAIFVVNGTVVHYIFDIRQPDTNDPGAWNPLTKGRLWFQAEGAEILYRKIDIRQLPPVSR